MGMGAELVSCMPGFIAAIFNEIVVVAQEHTQNTRRTDNKHATKYNDGNEQINAGKYSLSVRRGLRLPELLLKAELRKKVQKVIHEKLPGIVKEMFEENIREKKINNRKCHKKHLIVKHTKANTCHQAYLQPAVKGKSHPSLLMKALIK